MGIAKHRPDMEVPLVVNPTVAVSKQYETTLVDSKQTPLTSLRAYLDGMPWILDSYYVQQIGKNTGLFTVDTTVPNSYQSYEKIIGIEVRVQTALQNSFDEESALTTVNGSAIIPSIIVPSKGDVFIASAGFNRKAAFGITKVERLQFNTESAYQIDYELLFDISIDVDRHKDLEDKTQRTYYYHKERYIEGLDAKVLEEEHKLYLAIKEGYSSLVSYYFKTFFSSRVSTLILPNQDYVIYDHRLVEFLLSMVDTVDAFEVSNTRLLNIENDKFIKQECIYDAFMYRNVDILQSVHRKMGLTSTKNFGYDPMSHSIRYTGIEYVVYPFYPDRTMDSMGGDYPRPRYYAALDQTTSGPTHLTMIKRGYYVSGNLSIPFTPTIEGMDTYLFTDSFYNNGTVNTLLEIVLLDFINQRSIKAKEVYALLSSYRQWDRMAQFYYLPILIALLRFMNRK